MILEIPGMAESVNLNSRGMESTARASGPARLRNQWEQPPTSTQRGIITSGDRSGPLKDLAISRQAGRKRIIPWLTSRELRGLERPGALLYRIDACRSLPRHSSQTELGRCARSEVLFPLSCRGATIVRSRLELPPRAWPSPKERPAARQSALEPRIAERIRSGPTPALRKEPRR
jgi:hypothetical protein